MTYQKHRIPHKDWHLNEMKKIHLNQESLLQKFPDAKYICGVDESGTGSVFGPLSVGVAVLLRDSELQVKDSKAYTTDTARAKAYARVVQEVQFGKTLLAQAHVIDKYGMSKAKDYITFEILEEVVGFLDPAESVIVMDGAYIPKKIPDFLSPYRVVAVPKADATIKAVSAASVLAKVDKDNFLMDLLLSNPELERYELSSNKGYLTKSHTEAIKRFGLSEYHRHSIPVIKSIAKESYEKTVIC